MPADQELQRLAEYIRGPVVVMGMEEPVYIARISYGKDSLKMLDVIKSRGLPLDRITTTDVWATDTISASLPEIDAFKKRMDGWIFERYGIPVEHLCARNPDGTIRSYEQMFYHVPKRRSQDVQVERERERRIADGAATGFPVLGRPWCQTALKKRHQGIPTDPSNKVVPATQEEQAGRDSQRRSLPTAGSSRSTRSGTLFRWAIHESPK